MNEKEFALRLSALRNQKGVSAREMSLAIGQSEGYINSIENCRNLPSMAAFLFICEYLSVTPQQFFDSDAQNPEKLGRLIDNLKKLDEQQLDTISALVEGLIKK